MPKHYALGRNMQHQTAVFNNTKVVAIEYDEVFEKKPMIQLTINDSGTVPAYKTDVTKTGAKIRLKSNWTGEVDILIVER